MNTATQLKKTTLHGLSAFFMIILFVPVLNTAKVNAADIRVKGKLKNQTSYRVTLKKSSDITHWKIRMTALSPEGYQEEYSTIKKMKVSKTSYTVNDLEPDSFYYFEIIGCVKTDGKLKGVIYDYLYCYTGISSVGWNDYASSDAPCSPENITLWFYNYEDGLPAEGFEIYRREDDSEDWTLLATPDISTTEYDDKNIEAGKTYSYRFRSYGTYNGETLYSPYSEELSLSAVNQSGTYSSSLIKQTKSTVILKLTSDQYNGDLSLNSRYSVGIGEDMAQFDDYEDIPLKIAAVSTDGETWVKTDKNEEIVIKGGESLYLRLKPMRKSFDISVGNIIGGYGVYYNRLPSFFYLTLGESGSTWMNSEMIH